MACSRICVLVYLVNDIKLTQLSLRVYRNFYKNATDDLICTEWMHAGHSPLVYCSWDLMNSAIYLFGSHIYLGGMAQDCELNHSTRRCHCTGRSPWITHWKAITQTSKVHCQLISHHRPDQATDRSAMHTLQSLGTVTNSAPPSLLPISIPISILRWNHGITYSKVWVWLCLSKFYHSV